MKPEFNERTQLRWDRQQNRGAPDACWPWLGPIGGGERLNGVHGAPRFTWGRRIHQARRLALLVAGVEVPDDSMVVDLCHESSCTNPAHLTALPCRKALAAMPGSTAARNLAKTSCAHGHPYDVKNTYVNSKTGWRYCRRCIQDGKTSRARARRSA